MRIDFAGIFEGDTQQLLIFIFEIRYEFSPGMYSTVGNLPFHQFLVFGNADEKNAIQSRVCNVSTIYLSDFIFPFLKITGRRFGKGLEMRKYLIGIIEYLTGHLIFLI
ncbi:MAG: hypothetical protein NT002_12380 [candidate division Zixibacteria bacterium]|nr:hypothetical protein [candidate division Zixibacteria bacterium]